MYICNICIGMFLYVLLCVCVNRRNRERGANYFFLSIWILIEIKCINGEGKVWIPFYSYKLLVGEKRIKKNYFPYFSPLLFSSLPNVTQREIGGRERLVGGEGKRENERKNELQPHILSLLVCYFRNTVERCWRNYCREVERGKKNQYLTICVCWCMCVCVR